MGIAALDVLSGWVCVGRQPNTLKPPADLRLWWTEHIKFPDDNRDSNRRDYVRENQQRKVLASKQAINYTKGDNQGTCKRTKYF